MILRHGNFTLSRHLYNNDFTITKGRQIQCNGNNDVGTLLVCPKSKMKNSFQFLSISFETFTGSGQFSCLRSEVRFDRNFGHFLVKTYVPSCIIVLTAIFGFWVPPSAYPQRVTLYMSAMIALFTMQIQNTNTIKPSYIVSIQIWMTSCVVFVFICLLEFLIASTIDMKNKQLVITIRRQMLTDC